MGARLGGSRSPASSPWAMMMPPTMRVLSPQLVWCTGCCWPSWSKKEMPNALAKLVPRLWEVPACALSQHRGCAGLSAPQKHLSAAMSVPSIGSALLAMHTCMCVWRMYQCECSTKACQFARTCNARLSPIMPSMV